MQRRARLERGGHQAGLVGFDGVLRVGENDHAGRAAGRRDDVAGGQHGDLGGVGRHVGEQARGRIRARPDRGVPADHRNALRLGLPQGRLLPGGVESAQDDAGRPEGQREAEGGALPRDGPLAVQDAQRPADRTGRLLDALRHPGDTAVGQVGGHEYDQPWTLRRRPAQRAAVITGRAQRASDHRLRPLDDRVGGARRRGRAGTPAHHHDHGSQQRRHHHPDPASRRPRPADEHRTRPAGLPPRGAAWALTQ